MARPARIRLPADASAGQFAGETQVYQENVSPGKKIFESRRGITSHHANPFFALDWGDATNNTGEVWFGALGWSGNWKITTDHDAHGYLQVSGGINDFDFSWHLAGGEEFTTPSFIGGYTREGFGAASRNLHRYTLDHLLPTKGRCPFSTIPGRRPTSTLTNGDRPRWPKRQPF